MAYRGITLMGNGRTNTTVSTSGVVPAAAVAGDIAVLCGITSTNSSSTVALTGGVSTWTRVQSETSVNNNLHANLWVVKLATGDLGQTITLTATSGGWAMGTLVVMSGRDEPASALSSAATNASAATTLDSPTVSAVGGADLLTFWVGRALSASALTVSVPGAQTLAGTASSADSVSPNFVVAAAYKTNIPGGTAGAATGTYSTTYSAAISYTLVLPIADTGLKVSVVNSGGTTSRCSVYQVKSDGTLQQVSSRQS